MAGVYSLGAPLKVDVRLTTHPFRDQATLLLEEISPTYRSSITIYKYVPIFYPLLLS